MRLLILISLALSLYTRASEGLDERWKLIWSDEFNGAALDTSKWTARDQAGFEGNGEKEFNLASQVSVSDGKLVITSSNQSYDAAHPYRSGFLDTSNKFHATFGRWEVSAQLPKGKGMWPAHWMLSEVFCWPMGAEIDILELLGHQMGTVYGTYHFGSCCGCNTGNGSAHTVATDLSTGFHTYAVEWFPDNITWFLDDVAYKVVTNTSVNKGKPFTFDPSPHYWILNTAVGGYWPGNPDATTVFPQHHYVDYVRVYGWEPCAAGCGKGCCNTTSATCKCNWGYAGTNCEYLMQEKSFVNSLTSFDPSVEQIGGGNNGYVSYNATNTEFSPAGLTFVLNNNSCPSGCGGYHFVSGSWASKTAYHYGNFTYSIKASNYPGTAMVIWAEGSGSSWEAVQLVITGDSPTKMSAQYWIDDKGYWIGSFDLGFDASQAYHKYGFLYTNTSITVFVDNKSIAKTASSPSSFLQMSVQFQADPRYWGAFTYKGPARAFMNGVSWHTNEPTPDAKC